MRPAWRGRPSPVGRAGGACRRRGHGGASVSVSSLLATLEISMRIGTPRACHSAFTCGAVARGGLPRSPVRLGSRPATLARRLVKTPAHTGLLKLPSDVLLDVALFGHWPSARSSAAGALGAARGGVALALARS